MTSEVGVRELKNNTSRIVRAVKEEMAEYIITVNGEPVAVLRPFTPEDAQKVSNQLVSRELEAMKATAGKIGKSWSAELSGIEIIAEQRR